MGLKGSLGAIPAWSWRVLQGEGIAAATLLQISILALYSPVLRPLSTWVGRHAALEPSPGWPRRMWVFRRLGGIRRDTAGTPFCLRPSSRRNRDPESTANGSSPPVPQWSVSRTVVFLGRTSIRLSFCDGALRAMTASARRSNGRIGVSAWQSATTSSARKARP